MTFHVGQRVRFLRETGEGIIREVLSNGDYLVEIDGFDEMEVSAGEIVPVHENEVFFGKETSKEDTKKQAEEPDPQVFAIPTKDRIIEIRLKNPWKSRLFYNSVLRVRGGYEPFNSSRIEAGETGLLGTITNQEMHDVKFVLFQVIRTGFFEKKPLPVIEKKWDLRRTINENKPESIPGMDRDLYLFSLGEDPPEQAKAKEASKENESKPPEPIVDLHIDKIVKDSTGLDGATMLKIQLEHFEQQLNQGILYKLPEMVFIHGVGNFRLRDSLLDRCKTHPYVRFTEPADPLKYANGATLVKL